MIITVTLNPAVDKTIEVQNFKVGALNRVSTARSDVGGKGINVSKVIAALGGKSVALGFLGGESGDFIQRRIIDLKIQQDFVRVSNPTRTNIKLVDIGDSSLTEINESGKAISNQELDVFKEKFGNHVNAEDIVILSGSVPKNIPPSIYHDLIQTCKAKGAKVILDADGELLIHGLKAHPYIIKPNLHELSKIYTGDLTNQAKIVAFLRTLLRNGSKAVVLSMGKDGAIYTDVNCAYFLPPLKVQVKSTVGAGDAMVAGIAYALEQGYPPEDMIKMAVASATASITTEGTQPGTLETVQSFFSQIQLEEITGN